MSLAASGESLKRFMPACACVPALVPLHSSPCTKNSSPSTHWPRFRDVPALIGSLADAIPWSFVELSNFVSLLKKPQCARGRLRWRSYSRPLFTLFCRPASQARSSRAWHVHWKSTRQNYRDPKFIHFCPRWSMLGRNAHQKTEGPTQERRHNLTALYVKLHPQRVRPRVSFAYTR